MMTFAASDHGGPGPDLCQLPCVPRDATREEMEITQAWRRRARAEHPTAASRPPGVPVPVRVFSRTA
jgi:hypothetical protein